ncbi:hypothetical protein H0H92_007902 [Tricholoma furcatifolium]|nr:hypothetical protein H0H92_007902 [Tricholoma furcatifolium]
MTGSRRSSRLALAAVAPVDCGASVSVKRKRQEVETYDLSSESLSTDYTDPVEESDEILRSSKSNWRSKRSKSSMAEQGDYVEPQKSSRKRAGFKKGETMTKDLVEVAPTKRSRQPQLEPTFVIPDVELKSTTFKGRLGYACLNTILRNKRPSSDSVFCSRTCRLCFDRLDSLAKNGIEWVKDLGKKNVEDLLTMIQWNEDNHIRFLRISSEMFPFASHAEHGYSLEYCAPLLAKVGKLADQYGHRLTAHPGQFTQLGSPKPAVVQASIRELSYHAEMLDRMGIGVDGVLVVHGGGVYGDKASTLERIKKTITDILPPNVRSRLVLENDELCYNAEDLLQICEELDVPLVFDYHHDALNPSFIPPSIIIQRANAIFSRRGIRPKQHLSEPRPGAVTLMEKRAHADRCENLPADLPDDMGNATILLTPSSAD